jgi:hypothetical protein
MKKIEPNVIEEIERISLNGDEIRELIELGFKHNYFLDGTPGTAQTVEFSFDLGHSPVATITVKTLRRAYTERK